MRSAEEWFRAALKLDSKLIQAHRELIYIYGMQLRRPELNAQFLALSALTPLTSDNVFHWCLLHTNSWDPGEAVATLVRYVAADPDDRWSRLALAENYRRMGRFDQAESVLSPLAETYDSEATAIRAQIAVDTQQEDRAEQLLALARNDDPALARIRGRLSALETRQPGRPASLQDRIRSRPRGPRGSVRPRAAPRASGDSKAAAAVPRDGPQARAAKHARSSRGNPRGPGRPGPAARARRGVRRPIPRRGSPSPGTSWPSLMTRSIPFRSKPCTACATRIGKAARLLTPCPEATAPLENPDSSESRTSRNTQAAPRQSVRPGKERSSGPGDPAPATCRFAARGKLIEGASQVGRRFVSAQPGLVPWPS